MSQKMFNTGVFISFLFCLTFVRSQVGIGTLYPDASAQLDLVSEDKGVLLPRVALNSLTDTLTITNGNVVSLMVYNTTNSNDLVPGYYYWDGKVWQRFLIKEDKASEVTGLYSGQGDPTLTSPFEPEPGSVYVDGLTGNLYTFDGEGWVAQSHKINNGLIKTGDNTLQLGGELIVPTTIDTDETNTLAITGLEIAQEEEDEVLMLDSETNILKKSRVSSLVMQQESLVLADNGQNIFNTPLAITDIGKVEVYRNGVKIGFIMLNHNTIALETGVVCYQNDEIRIVQLF